MDTDNKHFLYETINSVLAGREMPRVDGITEGMKLREDLGFDSIALAELTVRLEDEFGVDVFESGIVESVGEILAKLPN